MSDLWSSPLRKETYGVPFGARRNNIGNVSCP